MHHGSSYNNYWTRDAQRKAEEKTVQVIQDNKFDIATLAYIYFFAKYVSPICPSFSDNVDQSSLGSALRNMS
jgi:hypothetical protein